MNVTLYRRLRLAVGGVVLALSALVFADVAGWLPEGAPRVVLWLQFVPSLLSFSGGGGWLATGFLAVIVLTILFGRVYCAMLCPLGVLMDWSAMLARRTGRARRLPFRPNPRVTRAAVVAICLSGIALGSAVPLGLLDPYSIFGKITSTTLRPFTAWIKDVLSALGWLAPVRMSPVALAAAGTGLGLLALIALAAVFRGRLWCNTVCPVGAVLGLLSRRPLFRLRIASEACIACSMCERVCPAQCIDFRNHRIDHSRCVMCFDCVASCRRNGISYGIGDKKHSPEKPTLPTPEPQVALPKSGRRALLGLAITLPVAALARREGGGGGQGHGQGGSGQGPGGGGGKGGGQGEGGGHGQGKGCDNDLTQYNRPPVLPPGARSLAHFQSRCTGCQLCVTHCPEQVLRPSISVHGLAGFLQPYQDFDVSFCSYNCSNCSEICPTGAIQTITIGERQLVQTGIAEFIRSRCVVKTDGTACGACSEHCPTQAVRMVPWRDGLTIPEIVPELCIGCGGCEYICPVRPYKAIIVKGIDVHAAAKPVERGGGNVEREMEEEFPF